MADHHRGLVCGCCVEGVTSRQTALVVIISLICEVDQFLCFQASQ